MRSLKTSIICMIRNDSSCAVSANTKVNNETRPQPSVRDLRFDTLRGPLSRLHDDQPPADGDPRVDRPADRDFFRRRGLCVPFGPPRGLGLHPQIARARARRPPVGGPSAGQRSIYRWHVALFIGAFVCVQVDRAACSASARPTCRGSSSSIPSRRSGSGLALLYQPGLLDLLPMYCAFVAAAPARHPGAWRRAGAGWSWR